MDEIEKNEIREAAVGQQRHWVRITYACNNKCLFCLDKENQRSAAVPMAEVIAELKKGLEAGAKRVVLSGGDPTVNPHLEQIIRKAKALGYQHVQIITNGRMLAYGSFAQKLKSAGLDEVTLSLHSHLRDDFEKMTRIKGSYAQAMRGLINAQQQGFIVSVDIVINKINYRKLRETLLFFIRLGVSEFDLLYPVPFGDAWENRKDLFFSPESGQKYIKQALELAKGSDLFVWTNRWPARYLEGFESLIQSPLKLKDEVRGMQGELKAWVNNGRKMSCQGERCKHCFMQDFCNDLGELLKEGKLLSKGTPNCLGSEKDVRVVQFSLDKKKNLSSFLDFYIKHRYFVKSLGCQKCLKNNNCHGAWIEDVRKKGFSILSPFAGVVAYEDNLKVDLLELAIFDDFKSKQLVRILGDQGFIESLKKRIDKEGLKISLDVAEFLVKADDKRLLRKSAGAGDGIAYVSKSPILVKQAKKIEAAIFGIKNGEGRITGNTQELGGILGYPKCCIDFFTQRIPYTTPQLNIAAKYESRSYSWYLNNLNRDMAFFHHAPCSYDCKKSIAIAKRNFQLFAKKYGKMAAHEVEDKLKGGFVYFDSGDFIRLDGVGNGEMFRYTGATYFFEKSRGLERDFFQHIIDALEKGDVVHEGKKGWRIENRAGENMLELSPELQAKVVFMVFT